MCSTLCICTQKPPSSPPGFCKIIFDLTKTALLLLAHSMYRFISAVYIENVLKIALLFTYIHTYVYLLTYNNKKLFSVRNRKCVMGTNFNELLK